MKQLSDKSKELYGLMVKRGYTPEFAMLITQELNTDFTASKMLGYFYQVSQPSMEEVADEMLAILSLRDNIIQKKVMEQAQSNYNMFLNSDLRGDDE